MTMNPLIRKEVRLLLPAWIAALAAATLPIWPWQDFVKNFEPVLFGAALLALALSSFGSETAHGTFGLLLVQPVERRRLWRVKTGLLALALASVWTLFTWAANDNFTAVKVTALMTVLAFSGGLWAILLLRDLVSALFCAFLVPAIICAVIIVVASRWINPAVDSRLTTVLCLALGAYAAAGFFWARRLFLNAQDVPWTGGQVSLSSLRWLSLRLEGGQDRWTAFVKKELQLQEIVMLLVPLLVVLHLVALVAAHFVSERVIKEVTRCAVPAIWLVVVPFLIGCVAVAEERRLNTLEGLLCLPITKRAQFAVKLAVALVLGTVLGGLLPWILAARNVWPGDTGLEFILGTAAAITLIAFYASTMSRGLLQAIPAALCPAVLTVAAFALGVKFVFGDGSVVLRPDNLLLPAIAIPVLAVTLVWLAFRNYQRLQTGWGMWTENFVQMAAVVVCLILVVGGIANRSWELLMRLEPRHGSARISGSGQTAIGTLGSEPVVLRGGKHPYFKAEMYVLLPDGRLWLGKMDRVWEIRHRVYDQFSIENLTGGFVPDRTWLQVAGNDRNGLVGLQTDGTLWRINSQSNVTQIGSDSDWARVSGGGVGYMAIKQDGTLWAWGPARSRQGRLSDWQSIFRHFDPARVGKDSDWVNIFVTEYGDAIGVKRDGSAWKWSEWQYGLNGQARRPNVVPFRWTMPGGNWLSIADNGCLGVRADGTLWPSDYFSEDIFGNRVPPGWHPEAVRIGKKSDWVALAMDGRQITALEANGTLWTMASGWMGQSKRPSRYSDWLAAGQQEKYTWGLARDGTLTCWDALSVNDPRYFSATPTFAEKFFLGPTRRPVLSINVFDKKL